MYDEEEDQCRSVHFRNDKGAALIEFCLILPVLLVLVFAIIDFGRLIMARLIITNVTREGANLASRDIKSGTDLIATPRSSATPLDLERGRPDMHLKY